MSSPTLVGISGSFNRPSRSRTLVEAVAREAADRHGFSLRLFDLQDAGPSLGSARLPGDLDVQAQRLIAEIVAADLLVIGTPTYKGSYPGLFKHLIDLIDPQALRGKPVLLTATGGGDRHALMVEHQLRPLFGFFAAHALPTAVYAADREFTDGRIASAPLRQRIGQAVDDLAPFFPVAAAAVAAE